jgi:para-nitrobenzyl esterase
METTVETTAGRVRGHRRRRVLRFQALPYATAARFRAPEPVPGWKGVREAAQPGPTAPQTSFLPAAIRRFAGGSSTGQSEDCLTLDVTTPACDGERRPVMVWIHGGGFTFGTGSAAIYDPTALARRGVVVVSIQYRLGALGFLQLPLLRSDGPFESNLGLRDQIEALRWVRDNASAFGGDPDNVTIFGESAGAMSVATLLGCPAAHGFFHRAICQSGAAHNTSRPEGAESIAAHFLGELDLKPENAEALREVPVRDLLGAQMRTSRKTALVHGGLPWQPALDAELLLEHPLDLLGAGGGAPVPLLIGTNRDEWNLFLLFDRQARRLTDAGLRRRLTRAVGDADAKEAHALYRDAYRDRSPRTCWGAFQTDRIFRAPAEHMADLHAAAGAPTWRYDFTWSPWVGRRVGACHAVELPLVFGSWRHGPPAALYAGAGRLSKEMLRTWTAFAAQGRPEQPEGWSDGSATVHTFGPQDPERREAFAAVRPWWAERGHGPTARASG